MRRRLARWVVGIAGAALLLAGMAEAQTKSCGPPPPATPQRRKGGESVPPLPLPATPLRRTEKKRPPAPPALVGKLQYGKTVWMKDAKGQPYSVQDWTTDPNDIAELVKLTNTALGIRYDAKMTDFPSFSYNPAEIPILLLTGHESFSLTAEQRQKLRAFINDGGSLIGDPCCGSPEFYESFVAEMKATFPDNPLRPLPDDHPLFRSHYAIQKVEVMIEGKAVGQQLSLLQGIGLGCRTAVFITPYDMTCGWDGHEHETGSRIRVEDARRLGVNIMTYCLADYQLGRFLSTRLAYHEEGEPTRDEMVFCQVMHNGDWDPGPNGVMALMKYVEQNSTLAMQFKRQTIRLSDADALNHPVLYMTGHDKFTLSEAEIAGLRNYLRNGGVLFANACCGRKKFDEAFRHAMGQAFGNEAALKPIPADHPLYAIRAPIAKVKYSEYFASKHPGVTAPTLEGITLDEQLCVIYSACGLGTEWDGQTRPFASTYQPDDALRLGMNALVYAMTH